MIKTGKKLQFKEEIVYSSNKIPNDPEGCFTKFADLLAKKDKSVGGVVLFQLKEVGPREKLSTFFDVFITGLKGNLKAKVRFIVEKKKVDIGYEAEYDLQKGEMKMVIKQTEKTMRKVFGTDIERAYEAAVGDDFISSGMKVKKPKKSRSQQYMDAVFNPEEDGKYSKLASKYREAVGDFQTQSAPKEVSDGSMCYIHSNVPATVYCDLCKKSICPECLRRPLDGNVR